MRHLRYALLGLVALAALLVSVPGANSAHISPAVFVTVPVGLFPGGVGVNPTADRIYVANIVDDTVSVIDGASNAVVATIAVGDDPFGVGVNPTTNRVYVSNRIDGTVSVIDGATNAVVATVAVAGAGDVGVNPSTNRVYVTGGGTVSVIDGASNAVVATVPVGAAPGDVGVNPTTNRVYVSNRIDGTVSVIDGASNAVVATVPVGSLPSGVAANPSTDRVYVSNRDDDTVSVIDGASNAVVATVPVGAAPGDVGVNPTTGHVYVATVGDTVSVIDGASNAVVATVPVGADPIGVGVNPSTDRVYVSNLFGHNVSVIENTLPDIDGDGVLNPDDNCPFVPNADQTDTDADGLGDACDTEGPSPNTNGLGGTDDCNDGVDNDGDGLTDGFDGGCLANNVTDTTNEDTADIWFPSVSNPDVGDTLTCTADAISTNGGTVTVTPDCSSGTYTPAANFNGSDTFSYTVSAGTLAGTATVTYTVNPVNGPPIAANITATTNEDTPVTITLSATDIDSCGLTFPPIVTPPANGSLSEINIGIGSCVTPPGAGSLSASVTYTPNTHFLGSDSFTYKANDGALDSNIATVTVCVIADQPSDIDGDGIDDACDNCPAWPNADQSLPPWPVMLDGSDPDCDGWTTSLENIIGTDPLLACGVGAWPPDFNDSLKVDIFDVNAMRPPMFFSETGDPDYSVRLDIVPSGRIDIFDVNALRPPIFFATCTP